jgi:hypothetical protein
MLSQRFRNNDRVGEVKVDPTRVHIAVANEKALIQALT